MFCVCYLFRADIIANFQVKSPLFSTYFYATFYLLTFSSSTTCWSCICFQKARAILQSFTREILIRIIVLALTLLTFYFVSLRQFVWLYAGHYLIPVIILVIAIYKKYPSPIGVGISRTTTDCFLFMSKMASWGIVQTIVSTGVPVLDTLVIGGIIGLKGVAEYQIMSYVSTLVQVPVRLPYLSWVLKFRSVDAKEFKWNSKCLSTDQYQLPGFWSPGGRGYSS
ncbi:MAG: hypothetical protein IPO25_23365 [Saprospiraceae bacterium]|nr:hypothetical protein [Saprospiraceae bacterium]